MTRRLTPFFRPALAAGCTTFALLATLTPGRAIAQESSVVLYGMVDDAVTYVNNQNGHANVYLRGGNLYASKFGLRGTEQLSSTTRALYDLQAGFDTNSGSAAASGLEFNREAFVGLDDTRYGTLTLGRQYTPYYLFVGPLTGSSLLTGANGAHPGDLDGLDTTTRVNSSISYATPVIDGFAASAMFAPGGGAGSVVNGDAISAALRYTGGPFAFAAGYVRLDNASTTTGWDASSTASFNTSVANQGYVSARAVQQFSVAATYAIGPWLAGVDYSHVAFLPGAKSVFTDTASFNIYSAVARYAFSKALDVTGGLSYARATRANGIENAARYEQASLREVFHLSPRTSLYALQTYAHARGDTLGTAGAGDVIAAGPVIGDAQNLTPSSTANQFMAMFGMAVVF
ncbi:porin [Robbsia sp. Bb-Pol-6]|uniref:Porin n=1 Tax=Robbsia betulipollinis TaxID=2981849 RepID=A0ABT3ZSC8_9BURK|nr:porin [Robbsia betulipollinis]MCY0389455.1 porin [Robbsia betulipollinis]